MQRPWLGDALDFWKRAFLESLRASSTPARPVQIVPMFSDAGWTTAETDTYAAILGVPPAALISTSTLTRHGRSSYFAATAGRADDIFVDPDKGIATGKPALSHVASGEVLAMLSSDNVVAVYQHRPRRGSGAWLARYARLLSAPGVTATGYQSAQVGMLFATRSDVRASAVRRALAALLGAVARPRGAIPGRIV